MRAYGRLHPPRDHHQPAAASGSRSKSPLKSVFDAAARAVSVLRRDAWIDGIGSATRLEIQVPQPAITHTVIVQQLERWANGSAVNPDERVRKDQLKAILGRTGE